MTMPRQIAALLLTVVALPSFAAPCDQADIFEKLDCQLRVTRKEREIAQEQQSLNQLQGAETGTADVSLLRVYGRPGALQAQFSRGRTTFVASRGDAVIDGCAIADIRAAGVTMRCANGRHVTLRLGGRADPVASPPPAAPITPVAAEPTPESP